MGERLTIEEIRRRYDGEWVLLVDFEEDPDGETTSGTVAAHGVERDDVYGAVPGLKPPLSFQTLCLKRVPEGWGLAL